MELKKIATGDSVTESNTRKSKYSYEDQLAADAVLHPPQRGTTPTVTPSYAALMNTDVPPPNYGYGEITDPASTRGASTNVNSIPQTTDTNTLAQATAISNKPNNQYISSDAVGQTTSSGGSTGIFDSQEDEINNRYDQLIAAERETIQKNIEASRSKYESDLEKALPEYQKRREQQALLTKQNAQRIAEYAFYSGDRGGMSRQDMLQNVNSGQEIIGAIGLQEQLLKDDTNRAITDLFNQGESDLAIAEARYAAERANALYQERVRLQESNAAWMKWLASETGYLPNGQQTLSREQFEYQKAQNSKNSSGGSSYGSYGGSYDAGYDTSGANTVMGDSYLPTAYASGNHAQYNADGTWQPYYTNDGMRTTPADYQAPKGTNDVASWIINNANQYSDGADVMSGITDAMRANLVMSYIGANFNGMSEQQQNTLLNYYGVTRDDLLKYFSV